MSTYNFRREMAGYANDPQPGIHWLQNAPHAAVYDRHQPEHYDIFEW